MIRGLIFDYGGTLDTKAVHWATMIWQAYERQEVPVSYEQFWEAYVHTERMLGRNPVIQKDFTFRKTLETKVEMQLRYLVECGVWSVERLLTTSTVALWRRRRRVPRCSDSCMSATR